MDPMVIVITGADGAGGGVILPAVGERLGLPVQARTAPDTVPNSGPGALPEAGYKQQSEAAIRAMAREGGVVRDGAAVVVLSPESITLRVRLDGPLEGRVRQTMAHLGDADEAEVRAELSKSDRAWADYHERAYGVDATEPGRYHMVLDSTALDWGLCVDLIELAARSHRSAGGVSAERPLSS